MITTVDKATLKNFQSKFDSYRYDIEGVHCYQKHIPHVAFIIVSGEAELKKKGETVLLPAGSIWGIVELLQQKPSEYDVIVKADTEIISLDRSTIMKFQEIFRPYLLPLGA